MEKPNHKDNTNEWLTTAQAAKILGVTAARVRQLIREGTVKAHRFGSRIYLVQRDSVYQYDQERGK